ncbi:hypothetical protein IQ06DRAFT_362590 [Phaeosphaeriaceae sp. SRC1lsM3a]|nr:hypothetical protein IQ06DRAFT_362590 [Stagonospora sp. SRC1lsM3a]
MSAGEAPANNTVSATADHFPHLHIEAFGAGEVGRVHVTFSPSGEVVKAEAGLAHAPFKRMLIDDTRILKMFGERGDIIDINLIHPAARFRLDPLEIIDDEDGELDMSSFDVGRLVDITHLPAAAKYGWSKNYLNKAEPKEEVEVHRRVRQDVEHEAQKKIERQSLKRKSPSRQPRLTHTRTQRKETAKEEAKEGLVRPADANGAVKLAVRLDVRTATDSFSPASQLRTLASKPEIPLDAKLRVSGLPSPDSEVTFPMKCATEDPLSKPARKGRNTGPIPNTAQGKKMGIVFNQILARLSDSDQATYTDMVTFDRREAARSETARRVFADRVYGFVRRRNIVGLHNAYAEAMKRNGTNKAYQLPVFHDNEAKQDNEMDIDDIPEAKRPETAKSGIYLTPAPGTPDAMFP